MLTRLFLGISGLAWAGYGVYCLIAPEALATVAGVAATLPSGVTDLRAMYGGAQIAIGLAVLAGAIRTTRVRWSLQFQAVIYLGIVPARLCSALATGDFSTYTIGAISFESLFLAITVFLLLRSSEP
jgi:hypothetical protein